MWLGTDLIFIPVPAQATAKMLLKTLYKEHDGRIRCQVMRAFAKAPEAVDVNFVFCFFSSICPGLFVYISFLGSTDCMDLG